MADDTVDDRQAIDAFADELGEVSPSFAATRMTTLSLDNVAVYDFAFHEFLLPTEQGYDPRPGLSDDGLDYLGALEDGGVPEAELEVLAVFLEGLEAALRRAFYAVNASTAETRLRAHLSTLYGQNLDLVRELFGRYVLVIASAATFFELLARHLEEYIAQRGGVSWPTWRDTAFFISMLAEQGNVSPCVFRDPTINSRTSELESWFLGEVCFGRVQEPDLAALRYEFEVFPHRSVNVGLRIVYSQEWRPLGVQPGEIVRTIPLGPGQTEKVTTRIVRRVKRASTLETATVTETLTETSESTKDSSEIVEEASSAFNLKHDAQASVSWGVFSGTASHSIGYASEDRSKETSASLSEVMKKTASKLRRETKVVVSTEAEERFEREIASEIANPNNEVGVTYEYHKLQQQYEVATTLAEVQAAIFVAEAVPLPVQIDEAWIRRHDWILARVLKDESLRQTLNELIQDVEEEPDALQETGNPRIFEEMLARARDQFAQFTNHGAGPGQGGLSMPDIYAEPQRVLLERLRETAARSRANRTRTIRRQRLIQHFRDNVLHYCRAIWRAEDPDQRLLRYKKEGRRVPAEWITRNFRILYTTFEATDFEPTGVDVPLVDLIDPTGPIAYFGNYAVFAVRPLESDFQVTEAGLVADLGTVLTMARLPYYEPVPENPRQQRLRDPAIIALRREAQGLDLARLGDSEVRDLISYLPELAARLLEHDANGQTVAGPGGEPRTRRDRGGNLVEAPSFEEYVTYLYRKNGTRRFLVDSNNLYLSLRTGAGATLEPFKRAHRYLDVLKAGEELLALRRKNAKRLAHAGQADAYDPDIEKVIVVGDCASAGNAAAHEAVSDPAAGADNGRDDGG